MKNITRIFVLVLFLSAGISAGSSSYGAIATKRFHTIATVIEKPATSARTAGVTSPDEDSFTPEQKGKMDADRFYDGWRPGKTWTLVTTALFGGILGLIPAIAISSTPPRPENLGYPNEALMKDERYKAAYQKEAKKIKSRKVWGGFGIGIIIAIVLYAIVTAA